MRNKKIFLCLVLMVCMLVAGCGLSKQATGDESTKGKKEETIYNSTENSVIDTEAEEISKTEESTEEATEETSAEDETTEESKENSSEETEEKNSQNKEEGGAENKTPSSSEKQETDRYVVEQYSMEEVKNPENFKYGILRTQIIDRTYYEYNDGTTEVVREYSYYEYDCSGYSASDADLKAESEINAANYMSYYNEVLRLTNEIRAEAGVGPLTLDTTLCKAASMRSLEMDYAQLFSHTRPNGSSCFTTMEYFGCSYTTCGENIAAGYGSPAAVVEGWKNSPGHYANMINPNFTKLGVGYTPTNVEGTYWNYWTQLFSN